MASVGGRRQPVSVTATRFQTMVRRHLRANHHRTNADRQSKWQEGLRGVGCDVQAVLLLARTDAFGVAEIVGELQVDAR